MPVFNRDTILQFCQASLEVRKAEYLAELESLKEAAAGEVKSSAGDKYETGREMIAQARGIIERNLGEALSNLEILERMRRAPAKNATEAISQIRFSSLVETDKGWYLFGVSLGEIEVQGGLVTLVSLSSPLGLAIRGKTAGETVAWRNSKLKILQVL